MPEDPAQEKRMQIKLSVPTNWQPQLLDRLNKTRIYEIYGKLDRDAVGGGRPPYILNSTSRCRATEHIRLVHKHGLRFNYLLNATCLGNIEWTSSGQRRIRKLLDWLAGASVDTVTVAVPYLLQLIKKCYPVFKVKVSICSGVDNAMQARYWQELGADEITLSSWSVNRNFGLLREIRKAVSCGLQVYANTRCLTGCPFTAYHYLAASHSSRAGGAKNDFFVDYCGLSCAYLTMLEPWRLIAGAWIRPEDLHYYGKEGINSVKLAERDIETEYIVRIVEAYTLERYDGNLMDLFVNSGKRSAGDARSFWKKFAYFFRPADVNVARLYRFLSRLPASEPVYLDNRKLDNFLEFFVQDKCGRSNCDACGYCLRKAKEALHLPEAYREKMIRFYGEFLESSLNKRLFSFTG